MCLHSRYHREKRRTQEFVFTEEKDGAAYGTDQSTVQKTQGTRTPMPPIANWMAQTGGGCPPDPSGAAGPNHYIQGVNATPIRIYSKTGTTMNELIYKDESYGIIGACFEVSKGI